MLNLDPKIFNCKKKKLLKKKFLFDNLDLMILISFFNNFISDIIFFLKWISVLGVTSLDLTC